MSERVSEAFSIGPNHSRYVFLFITWNDYLNDVVQEFDRQYDAFGYDLGIDGVAVQPYPRSMAEVAETVIAKPWPNEIAERLKSDQDPILLVFDRDWKMFDPLVVCGQQSLAVFCVGVFLSFVGHFALLLSSGSLLSQIFVSVSGIAIMTIVAYYISWSKRQDKPLPKAAPAKAS